MAIKIKTVNYEDFMKVVYNSPTPVVLTTGRHVGRSSYDRYLRYWAEMMNVLDPPHVILPLEGSQIAKTILPLCPWGRYAIYHRNSVLDPDPLADFVAEGRVELATRQDRGYSSRYIIFEKIEDAALWKLRH